MRANAQLDHGQPPDAACVALAVRVKCHEIVCSGFQDILYSPAFRSARKLCADGAQEARRATGESSAPRSRATNNRFAAGQRRLGGRSFSSVILTRATARFLSRRFTRAKCRCPLPLVLAPPTALARGVILRHPAVTTHQLLLTTHCSRGGTLNRPRAHVSHRKQTTGHMQGRNFPVHFLFSIFGQNPIALALRRSTRRSLNSARRPSHSPRITRRLPFLPGTVTRVETHLSHRKQTPGHASTRNVPAHAIFRLAFSSALRLSLAAPGSSAAVELRYHESGILILGDHNSGSGN